MKTITTSEVQAKLEAGEAPVLDENGNQKTYKDGSPQYQFASFHLLDKVVVNQGGEPCHNRLYLKTFCGLQRRYNLPCQLEDKQQSEYFPREGACCEKKCCGEIEKHHSKGAYEAEDFEAEEVIFVGRGAYFAMLAPLSQGGLRLGHSERVGCKHLRGVVTTAVLVDEHIIGAVGLVIMVDKAVVGEEKAAAIAEVATVAGKWAVEDGGAEILHAVGHIVVLLEPVKQRGFVLYTAET